MHCVKVSILGECGKIRTRKTRNTDTFHVNTRQTINWKTIKWIYEVNIISL